MTAIRTVVIDDEPLARERVKGFLKKIPDVQLVGEAGDGPSAIELIEVQNPDLVVLDVPCTGTGTWRRNPDLLWRYGEKNLEQLRQTQQRIFAAGAKLVKPGGRLAYLTCSFLNGENEDQVSAFLNTHPAFEIIPVATLWHDAFGTPCPITQDALRLSPAAHHCDGFFGCYLQRKS